MVKLSPDLTMAVQLDPKDARALYARGPLTAWIGFMLHCMSLLLAQSCRACGRLSRPLSGV